MTITSPVAAEVQPDSTQRKLTQLDPTLDWRDPEIRLNMALAPKLTDSFRIELVWRNPAMGRRRCGQVMCGNGQGMAGLTGVGAVAEERRDSDFVGLVWSWGGRERGHV